MTQISPWSVKGVAPEDREAAKRAARKAGLPVGAWLSQTIRDAGQPNSLATPAPAPAADPDVRAELHALRAELAALSGRFEAMREEALRLRAELGELRASHSADLAEPPAGAAGSPGPLGSQAALERAVLRLSGRLQLLEATNEAARARAGAGWLGRLFQRGR